MIIKEILTILIIFSSFLMLYLTFLNIKNKILNFYEGVIWLLIWLISLFISIRPKTIDNFIEIKLGVSFFYISTILAMSAGSPSIMRRASKPYSCLPISE